MGNIMLLMGVILYIYAVAGQQLFHEHEQKHWGNLGISLLTLLKIVTCGGLNRCDIYGDGDALTCLDLLCQLRDHGNLCDYQSVYCRGVE